MAPSKQGQFMSQSRRTQWTQRLTRLHELRESFSRMGRHDRAYKAYLVVQHAYERWAEEVFAGERA
jgi:hypothetical protein